LTECKKETKETSLMAQETMLYAVHGSKCHIPVVWTSDFNSKC